MTDGIEHMSDTDTRAALTRALVTQAKVNALLFDTVIELGHELDHMHSQLGHHQRALEAILALVDMVATDAGLVTPEELQANLKLVALDGERVDSNSDSLP